MVFVFAVLGLIGAAHRCFFGHRMNFLLCFNTCGILKQQSKHQQFLKKYYSLCLRKQKHNHLMEDHLVDSF